MGLVLAAVFVAVPAIIHAADTNSVAAAAKPVPYPLKTCVVSGDKLGGDMGAPIVFIYTNQWRQPGDQVLLPDCKPKFVAEPDKYMKIIRRPRRKQKKGRQELTA